MAVRSDVDMLWYLSPRALFVRAPSVEMTIQDLHDTLRFLEDSPEGEGEDLLIDSAGKDVLSGGVQVGITATLLNTQLAFEGRHMPSNEGTVTTPDVTGSILTDSAADFVAGGVQSGDCIVNFTDLSMGEVLQVLSPTQLRMVALTHGLDNEWGSGDTYRIYAVAQCVVSGGNLVAVDADGDPLSPILPTAHTQVIISASSSATIAIPDSAFKVGVDYPGFTFQMISETTRKPQNGFTVTGERYVQGGSWTPLTNAVIDIGGGDYIVDFAGTDIPNVRTTFRFSASGAVTRSISIYAAAA